MILLLASRNWEALSQCHILCGYFQDLHNLVSQMILVSCKMLDCPFHYKRSSLLDGKICYSQNIQFKIILLLIVDIVKWNLHNMLSDWPRNSLQSSLLRQTTLRICRDDLHRVKPGLYPALSFLYTACLKPLAGLTVLLLEHLAFVVQNSHFILGECFGVKFESEKSVWFVRCDRPKTLY